MLRPIKVRNVSDQVFDQLRELIYRGKMKPGDRIMTERALAESLKVSRTAVRDAIKRLVAQGLVEQRQGSGTYVKLVDEGSFLQRAMDVESATLHDLLEVRMGLECNTAAMAARRADDVDFDALEESLARMRALKTKGEVRGDADVAFHMALAFATKNPLQIFLMRQIHDVLFSGIHVVLKQLYETPENMAIVICQHEAVVEGVRLRDPEAAVRAMEAHIRFVIAFVDQKTGMAL